MDFFGKKKKFISQRAKHFKIIIYLQTVIKLLGLPCEKITWGFTNPDVKIVSWDELVVFAAKFSDIGVYDTGCLISVMSTWV